MTDQPEHSGGLWGQVVAILTSPAGAPELGIEPLRAPHKALLRSVRHTGEFQGFFLLSTESTIVQTLVKEELKGTIETVLEHLTGEQMETVITVDDPAERPPRTRLRQPTHQLPQRSRDLRHEPRPRHRSPRQTPRHTAPPRPTPRPLPRGLRLITSLSQRRTPACRRRIRPRRLQQPRLPPAQMLSPRSDIRRRRIRKPSRTSTINAISVRLITAPRIR